MSTPVERSTAVIAYASSLGYVVTAAQLSRWHRAGLLPRPRQQSLGRGRGTATVYPHETSIQVVALCEIRKRERRLDRVAFQLWWAGFSVDHAAIQSVLAASAQSFDAEIRHATDINSLGSGAPANRRGMRRASMAAMSTIMATHAEPQVSQPVTIAWNGETPPPSLEELGALMGNALAARLKKWSSVEALVAAATADELAHARDRARALLQLMQTALAPMAWLYGRRGEVFRAMDRLLSDLSPSDYVGLVTAMLICAPFVEPAILASIDTGVQPVLATQLRQILAVRDHVPGAAAVITPKAVRALFQGKQSGRYYSPPIERFAALHRQEIDAVLTSLQPAVLDDRAAPAKHA